MAETLSQKAYAQIKLDILEGRIAPDTILSERVLADDLAISRTPLRSALSRLEREGVVSRLANGALLVASVSVETLLEIAQMRSLLETAAAARAAERVAAGHEPGRLAGLRDQIAQAIETRATACFDDFWREDEAFHLAVAEAAGFTVLPGILAEARATARRCTITRSHDDFTRQRAEHLAVADAVLAGDANAAARGMQVHFDHVRERFLSCLAR